jgi:hypothetical protein
MQFDFGFQRALCVRRGFGHRKVQCPKSKVCVPRLRFFLKGPLVAMATVLCKDFGHLDIGLWTLTLDIGLWTLDFFSYDACTLLARNKKILREVCDEISGRF